MDFLGLQSLCSALVAPKNGTFPAPHPPNHRHHHPQLKHTAAETSHYPPAVLAHKEPNKWSVVGESAHDFKLKELKLSSIFIWYLGPLMLSASFMEASACVCDWLSFWCASQPVVSTWEQQLDVPSIQRFPLLYFSSWGYCSWFNIYLWSGARRLSGVCCDEKLIFQHSSHPLTKNYSLIAAYIDFWGWCGQKSLLEVFQPKKICCVVLKGCINDLISVTHPLL